MVRDTLGGYPSIDAFVAAKLKRFHAMPADFASLYELMFSERGNIMYEKSEGYRIVRSTYGAVYERIEAISPALKAALNGLAPNSVVGLSMANDLHWLEAFWAILRSGFRPLLMNLRLSDEMLEDALSACAAAAVVSDGKRFSRKTVLFGELTPAAPLAHDAPFGTELLVMSSGTSSHVKLCAYSPEEFRFQIDDSYQIIRECSQTKKHYNGQLKQLVFLPFYHIFGLVAVYIWFAFFSRTFVQLNDLAPQTIVGTIKRHEVTHIFAVPLFWQTVYEQAIKTIHARGEKTEKKFEKALRLSCAIGGVPGLRSAFRRLAFREVRENLFGESICFMITGGSEIPTRVLEFFNGIGYHLADGYGMSEIGITSVELSGNSKLLNAGFVGKPMSSIEYRIDENGCLLVRGRALAKYVIEDGVTKPRGDWFRTRDLAECVNGHYRILGRSDDLVVAADGENLNPNLIEPLLEHPDVRGVCLIRAQIPTLLVSVGDACPPDKRRALRAAVNARLNEHNLTGRIGRIALISDPLMTAEEFKYNRRRLARDYAAGRLHVLADDVREEETVRSDTASVIRTMFAEALGRPAEEIAPDADFFLDAGGSSLYYFALSAALEEKFSVSFPTDNGKSLSTVRELSEYIEKVIGNVD